MTTTTNIHLNSDAALDPMPTPAPARRNLGAAVLRAALASLALLAALCAQRAQAADDPLSFNIGVTSDYRYRGISQSRLSPALQGGADYVAASGWYAGAWGSTIHWIRDNGVRGAVELDLYGGWRRELDTALSLDIGVLRYAYLGNRLADAGGGGLYRNADTTEIYGALGHGPVSAKLSWSQGNLFGACSAGCSRASAGSLYAELNGSFELGHGFVLAPHLGHQEVAHLAQGAYTDWALALTRDVGHGISLGASVVGTTADRTFYVPGIAAGSDRFLGRTGLLLNLRAGF